MKHFTAFPIEATALLTLNDLYALVGLYFTAHDDYNTDVTYEQLAGITGQSLGYLKDHFSKRLAESRFVRSVITHSPNDYKKKKTYHLPKPESMYRIIRNGIFEDNILTSEEKGFLIALYCHCVNDTFNIGLKPKQIMGRTKIKKTTFHKYWKSLQDKGYLRKLENVPLNPYSADHPEDYMLICHWLGYENYIQWLKKWEDTTEEVTDLFALKRAS